MGRKPLYISGFRPVDVEVRGGLKLAPEVRDARGLGESGRLGHGPGWL